MLSAISLTLRRTVWASICCIAMLLALTNMALAQQTLNSDSPGPAVPAPGSGAGEKAAGKTTAGDKDSKEVPVSAPAEKKVAVDDATLREMEEIHATIKKLEDRLEELESKVAKTETASTASVKEVGEVKKDVAKMQDDKKQEDKEVGPILSFFKSTEISGFVDAYYSYDFNRPDGDIPLRNFDTKHNQFALNLAKLALEKKPTADSRLGFRTDFIFGPAAEIVHSSEPGGEGVFRHIEQAYISYLAPVGKGLQLDFGKFVTWDGAEVIETKDNWNYSRSLLFALAIPYYHFGLRATYPVNDKLTLAGYLVNGWNDVVANNHRKTYGFTVNWKPTAKLSIIQNYTGGPTQPNDNRDFRHLYDTTVTYNATDKLAFMANYDYGKDSVNGTGVHWQGIAGYFRVQANKWLAFSPRFEWYDDHDGFTTGLAQTLKEITITSEQKIYGSLLTRFEYRRDFSNKDFFSKPINGFVPGQTTVLFGIVYAFSSKGE